MKALVARVLAPLLAGGVLWTLSPTLLPGQPRNVSLDIGVAHLPWITGSALATTLVAQADLFRVSRAAVIAGVGVSLNLQDRSTPFGTGTRRTDLGTARLGLEAPVARVSSASIYASASLAGSWFWSSYGGSSIGGEVNGGGWVSGIYGLRAELGDPGSSGLSIRYEIRPRFGTLASFNPYFGVGIAF